MTILNTLMRTVTSTSTCLGLLCCLTLSTGMSAANIFHETEVGAVCMNVVEETPEDYSSAEFIQNAVVKESFSAPFMSMMMDCTVENTATGTATNYGNASFYTIQTWTAECDGNWTTLDFNLSNVFNGNTVDLKYGAGDFLNNATATVQAINPVSGDNSITLSTPLSITNGSVYYFVFQVTNGTNINIPRNSSNPYTGGAWAFKSSSHTPPTGNHDMVFSVSIESPNGTHTVNDSGDGADANPGDGTCADSGGNCTFRAAIEEINASAAAGTINFSVTTVNVASTLPTPSQAMSINVGGANTVTIDASGMASGYLIVLSDHDGDLTLDNMIWQNGPDFCFRSAQSTLIATNCLFQGFPNNFIYGGSFVGETGLVLDLENCTFKDSYAAVAQPNGDCIIKNCTFTNLTGDHNGNAIKAANNTGSMTLINCTITGNNAQSAGNAAVRKYSGGFTAINTIISGNTPEDIHYENSSTGTITNCLINICGGASSPCNALTAQSPVLGSAQTCGLQTEFPVATGGLADGTGDLGSATANDICGVARGASTNIGSTESVDALFGEALDFDGSDDYVVTSVQEEMNFNQQLTLEAWINVDNYGSGHKRLVNQHGHNNDIGWSFRVIDVNEIGFFLDDGSAHTEGTTTNNPISAGTWTHVAVVYDGTAVGNDDKVEFFINGVEVSDGNKSLDANFITALPNHITPLVLGARSDQFGTNYPGQMDEVRVWTRALTEAEISANYQCELAGGETGLFAYYKFNHGIASGNNAGVTTLTDHSGNSGRDGTLGGPFTLDTGNSNWVAPGGTVSGTCTPLVAAEALDFDGTDDYIEVPDDASLDFGPSDAYTLETWFYKNAENSATTATHFIHKGVPGNQNYLLGIAGSNNAEVNKVFFTTGTTINYGTTVAALDTWHHVAVTYDNGSYVLYLNGNVESSGSVTGGATDNEAMRIAWSAHGTDAARNRSIDGKLDEMRIWSRALHQAEIQAQMNCELAGNEADLVAYYNFNQGFDSANNAGETTVTDATSNGNNGTLTNFALNGASSNWVAPGSGVTGTCVPLVAAEALHFDGTNDYIDVPYDAALNTTAFTVQFWANVEGGAGNWRSPISNRAVSPGSAGYQFYASNNDKWEFYTGNGQGGGAGTWDAIVSSEDVALNTWTNIAGTYDGTTMRLYINGVLEGTLTAPLVLNATSDLRIGAGLAESATPGFYFPGSIDEVKLWNRALCQAEIIGQMNCEIAGNESGLVAYYDFNQGFVGVNNAAEATLDDATLNNHDGTLTGFALDGATSNWVADGDNVSGSCSAITCAPDAEALDFDGTDDYIEVPDDASLDFGPSDAYTLETWFYKNAENSATTATHFIHKGVPGNQNYLLGIAGSNNAEVNKVFFTTGTTINYGTTVAALDTWHHVAVSYDNGSYVLYLNGNVESSGTVTGGATDNEAMRIAWSAHGTDAARNRSIDGKLDEMRIWNRALCQAEIQAQMNCPLVGDETNLVAYYNFNQGADGANNAGHTILIDATANGNNGTLTNFALDGASSNWVAPGSGVTGSCTAASCCDITITGVNITQHETCPGASDGELTVTATCSTCTSIEYSVNGGAYQTDANFTGVASGTVTINVRDSGDHSCNDSDNSASVNAGTDSTPPTAMCQDVTVTLGAGGTGTTTAAAVNNSSSDNCDGSPSLSLNQTSFDCNDVGGDFGTALDFDGVDDEVSLPDNMLNAHNTGTFEAWAIFDNSNATYTLIGSSTTTGGLQKFQIYRSANGKMNVNIRTPNTIVRTINTIPDDVWTHVAVSSDGSTTKIFINGVEETTETSTGTDAGYWFADAVDGNTNYDFGLLDRSCCGPTTELDGSMDEVRIWSTARSAAEIQATMNTELVGNEAGLVAYYNFNEGSGSTLTDLTTGGNNGTLDHMDPATDWISSGAASSISVTLTVQDASGNSSTCTAAVTVEDNINPTITCPAAASGTTDNDLCTSSTVSLGTPTADDNCDGETVSNDAPANFQLGNSTVVWTVTDIAGNTATCNQTVTVTDDQDPNAICQDATVVLGAGGTGTLSVSQVNNGSSDNCDSSPMITLSQTSFDCDDLGGAANNHALDFEVAGEGYVNISDVTSDMQGLSNWSIEMQIRSTQTGSTYLLLAEQDPSFDNRFLIHLNSNDIRFASDGQYRITSTTIVNDGNWHHVVGTYDGSVLRLYIDGVADGTSGVSITLGNDSFWSLGADLDAVGNTSRPVDADIDEVRFWNKTLSQSEITDIFNNGVSGSEANLVSYYNMEDGSGTTLTDVKGDNDGTLINMTGPWISPGSSLVSGGGGNTQEVTLTVTDASSNSATCTANITVEDNTNPTVTCQDATLTLDGSGNATLTTGDVHDTSSDNCTTVNLSLSQTAFDCTDVPNSPVSVTLTATDGSDNTATCTANVTVNHSNSHTFTVDNSGDGADATPGDCLCADANGDCTFRAAIEEINASGSAGTINFSVTTVNVASTLPTPSQAMSINVGGANTVTIDASGMASGYLIVLSDHDGDLTLDNMIWQNGPDNCFRSAQSTLIATNCMFQGFNNNFIYSGSFVGELGLVLDLDNCTFKDSYGAVIQANGDSEITNCTFTNLTGDHNGNAIRATNNTGSMTLVNCTITGNNAQSAGNAAVRKYSGGFTAINTIIAGNTPEDIHYEDSNTGTITNCIIGNCGGSSSPCSSITSQDPNLGAAQTCGIQTYFEPNPGSPALDGGTSTGAPSDDICGNSRGATLDIGSYESGNASCDIAITGVTVDQHEGCPGASDGQVTVTATCTSCASIEYSINGGAYQSSATFTGVPAGTVNVSARDTGDNSCNDSDNSATVNAGSDSTAPTAECQDVTVTLGAGGTGTTTAAAVDNGSSDNCDGSPTITLSQTSFDCDDISPTRYSLDFDGSNDRVNLGDVNDGGTGDFTWEVWVKTTSTVTSQHLIAKRPGGQANGYEVRMRTGGIVSASSIDGNTNSDALSTTAINDGEWHHVAAVFDRSANISIYVDGVLEGFSDMTSESGNISNSSLLYFGARSTNSSYLDGQLAEIRYWTTARSTAEIQANMNSSLVGNEAGLNGYWNFSDGPGSSTLSDQVGTDDGTLTNMDAATDWLEDSPLGGVSVTLTVTDASTNSSTCTATVTVQDTTNPTITCPAAASDTTDNDLCTSSTVSLGTPTTDDNCAGETASNDAPANFPLGNTTVEWTVTDASGNTATCNQTVTVTDGQNPNAVCQDYTAQIDGTGNATVTAADINNNSSDNCGTANLSISAGTTAYTCADAGEDFVVTLSVDDGNGNTATCNATVNVADGSGNCAGALALDFDGTDDYIEVPDNNSLDFGPSAAYTLETWFYKDAENSATTATHFIHKGVPGNQNYILGLAGSNNSNVNKVFYTTGTTINYGTTIVALDTWHHVAVTYDNGSYVLYLNGNVESSGTVTGGATDNEAMRIAWSAHGTDAARNRSIDGKLDEMRIWSRALCQLEIQGYMNCALEGNEADLVAYYNFDQGFDSANNAGENTLIDQTGVNDGTLVNFALDGASSNWVAPGASISGSCDAVSCCEITVDDVAVTHEGCPDADDGTITVTATCNSCDNASDIRYSIDGTNFQTSNVFNNVADGTYTITVRDVNNEDCNASDAGNVINAGTDSTNPTASCEDATIELGSGGTASITASDLANDHAAASTDNCSTILSFSSDVTSVSCSDIGTPVTVTVTVTDEASNSANCTFEATVVDNIDPTITCPGDVSIGTDSGVCTGIATFADATGTDNCTVTISQGEGPASGSAFDLGTTSVGYTATDSGGNTATCTFTVTVSDDDGPTAECQDVTLTLDAMGNATLTEAQVNNGSSDNCSDAGALTLSLSQTAFDCDDATVSGSSLDFNGSDGTVSTSDVDALDGIPAMTIEGWFFLDALSNNRFLVNKQGAANASTDGNAVGFGFRTGSGSYGDGNDLVLLMNDNGSGAGAITAVYTTSDVLDGLTGSWHHLAVVYNGNESGNDKAKFYVDGVEQTVKGNRSSLPSTTNASNPYPLYLGSRNDLNSYFDGKMDEIRIWNIARSEGEIQSTMNTTLAGNEAGLVSYYQFNEGSGTSTTDAASGNNGTLVDGVVFDSSQPLGGANTVTLTVTDEANNSSTCEATITVQDTTDPTVTCRNIDAELTASDDVVVNPADLVTTSGDNCTNVTLSIDGGSVTYECSDLGAQFTITVTATDDAGNTATCDAIVTVTDPNEHCCDISIDDNTVVVPSCPGNDDGSITVTATCSLCTSIEYSIDGGAFGSSNSFSGLAAGDYDIAVRDSGNHGCTTSQTVTVGAGVDTTDPVITCPGAQTVSADASCAGGVPDLTGLASATDNCSEAGNINITQDIASGTALTLNTATTVTLTATDEGTNTHTCTVDVTLIDDTAPDISCPADVPMNTGPDFCSASVFLTPPTATDNCSSTFTITANGGSVFIQNPFPGFYFGQFPVGTTTVTWTVTDENGQSTTCTNDVIITDDSAPTFTNCPANDLTGISDAENCGTNVTWSAIFFQDNCGTQTTLTFTHDSGDFFPVGTTTVTYTATDPSGNSTDCMFDVIVTDDTPPVVSCQDIEVFLDGDGAASIVVADVVTGVTDNCTVDIANVSLDISSFDCSQAGTAVTVTASVNDLNGVSGSCTAEVTVTDNTDPSAVCQDVTVSLDASGMGSVDATDLDDGSDDNCPNHTIAITDGQTSYDCTDAGQSYTLTLTVTDASNNTATCTSTVSVVDDTNPTITCPIDVSVGTDAGECTAVVTFTDPAGADNCSGHTVEQGEGMASGSAFPTGVNTVGYTVTDASGNTATCSFTITVSDDENPAIAGCPSDITQDNDEDACNAVVNWTAPTASDNCGVDSFTSTHDSGDTFDVGTATVTYTAMDEAGNSSTCSFTVTVNDTQAPAITCPADIAIGTDDNVCTAVVSYTAPVGTDNCAGQTTELVAGGADGSTFDLGETTVTYSVTDAAGNETSCSFTVTVSDDENPVITVCPDDATINMDAGVCEGTVTDLVAGSTATDNCTSSVTITQSPTAGSTFGAAHGDTQTVTITATDEANNSSTCTVVLTLNDNQDPTITACPADIVQATDADVCTAVVNWTAPTGDDNCAGTVGSSHDSGDTFDLGTTEVTYSVTDAAGNQVSCSFNVTINDEQDPTITCPDDISVGTDDAVCTAVVTFTTPDGADNCSGHSVAQTAGDASGSAFALGETTVTFEVTDGSGNTADCSFTVTVSDDEAPSIAGCPANISQDNDAGNCSAAVSWTAPTAADNCGVDSFTSTSQIGDTFDVGDTDVTYTAVDEAGNETTCTFTITVVDAEDPQITCPANITQTNDAGVCGANITYTAPVGTDNCDGSVTSLDEGQASETVFAVGTTTVSYSVVDAAGNTADCSFTVTVTDDENPTIADCPSDITQDNDDTFCGANVSWTAPTADDNCNVASFPSTSNIGDFFPVGDTEVTYTATDDAGNTAQCSFTITVVDAEAPQITCPANITQDNDTGVCTAVVNWTAPVGTDNCPGSVTELQTTDYPIGATFPLGSTDVTYSVADAAGNETSCTFSVTIVDAENPVAICQDITVELDAAGEGSIEASDVNNNSTDNCNIASMSVDPRIFDCSHVGANTVTLTVVDDAGNEHTCDATVTIEDNVAPIAICQDITIQLDEAGAVSIEAADVDNNSNDACGIDGLAIDISSFDCSNLGANTVTLTVTDNNSNESTCTSTVTVEDTVAPVINDCPENISVDAIATSCAASASWTEPTYSDNCVDYSVSLDTEGVPTIDLGTVVFGTFPGGETTISYTVTDPQGNESICSFTVTVVDNVGPVLTGCPDDIVVDNTSGECSGQAFWTAPIPSDNCTGFTLSASHNSGESFEVGSTTVTYTATDANDNESTCSFNVTVNDTEAPTVDCPETVEADAAGDCGYQIPDLSGLVTSSDNCAGDLTTTQSPDAGTSISSGTSVTVTVSDGTNSADCSVSITVPEDLSLSTTSTDASCDDSSDGSATVTISGGTAPYTISWSSGGDSETESGLSVGDHTVDVTDANGCTASATVTIGSNDTTPPTLFCDDHTVLLDANGEASITINDVAIVMEDNCGLASMSISQDNFTCANIGANTVTVTVTDAAGLTSTCDATVTVEDNMVSTPPFCGSTIDLQLGSDGLVSIGAGNFDPVMDNCGTALDILILGQSTFTCGFSGLSLVVPVAVLDESENFSICTVTVNISDAIAPTAVCENTTVSLGSDGTASIGASDVDGGSDDNCGIESSIVTPSSFDCGDLGANTVTLVVTDEGGLTASCTATVTVVDDSAPTPLYCDDQVSLVLDASGSASLTTANFDSAVDNCTSSPTISILGQSSFDCSDAGNTVVVAVSATDAQSNVAQCNINVSVVDNTDPVALCQDASVVADGNGIATVDASAINNASFDNCSIASMTATPNTFSCSGDSDNVVTLTVTDPSGNTATCTATVTVTGGGGAGLQANCQDVTVSLDASGNASITAADVDNGSFGCGVSLSVSPSSFTCANAGNNQVTLTATESGGGTATCTAMVMVVDDINPVASCQDISVTLDAGTGMAVIVGGDVNDGSTDNCGVDVMNVSPSVFTCEDGGDNTVTLTVTDAAGNSSTCAARVSVGYAAPTAMCQASAVTVGLGTDGTATVDPAVIDNGSSGMCDDLTMSVLPATFDCADAGSNPITLIVTDGLGQTASCTATVNIIDNSVPMPDFCGGSVNIELDADGSVNIEESGFGTHLDNCGSTPLVIISLGQINFTCADIGTTSDLLVAMIDGAGNLVTCFTDVVVTDPDGHCGSGLMVNEDLLNGVQTEKAEKPQIEVWQPELDENQNSLELRGLTNTPNPFSYQTKISYRLTAPAEVQMWVMDESGRMVTMLTRGAKAAGEHNVFWQPGANVAHGVYFLMVRLDNGQIGHLKMHYTK